MGALLSRWKAKLTTVELLEGLNKDIQTLEEHREKTQKRLKSWVYRLLLYSALLYLVACAVVYIWYIPEQLMGKLIVASPFLLFPPLVWLLRKMLITFYSKRTERNDEKLKELKAEKKKILEQVMETETYKNAKLILERFDPDSKKNIELDTARGRPPIAPQQGQELRQRHITPRVPVDVTPNLTTEVVRPPSTPAPISAPGGPPERNLASSAKHPNNLRRIAIPSCSAVTGVGMHPPGPPLVRPVLPRERGTLDKVIEYIVGDGPQNRYALICQQCLSHNGMALKEEFEYIAFRCAYCYVLNPARKTRPQAPQLPEFGENKTTSLGPSTLALEKDQYAPASPLVTKPITVKEVMEPKEHQVTEGQNEMEDQPVLEPTTKLSETSNLLDNEHEISAMEIE